jgi:hypothetical protein
VVRRVLRGRKQPIRGKKNARLAGSLPTLWWRQTECKLLLNRCYTRAQAGLVARRRIFVQRAFLDSLIQGGNGLAIGLLGGGLVALGDSLTQFTQLRAQRRSVGAVASRATFSLAGALQRRKMICHVWFVTFVYLERYSGGSELLIIGVRRSAGQTGEINGKGDNH